MRADVPLNRDLRLAYFNVALDPHFQKASRQRAAIARRYRETAAKSGHRTGDAGIVPRFSVVA